MELQNKASELANKIKDITSEHPFMSLATLGAITVPYFLYKRYAYYSKVNLPLVPGIPFLGTYMDVKTYYKDIDKYHTSLGKTFQLYLLGRHIIFSSDYKFIKYVFDHRAKYPMPDDIRRAFTYTTGLTMFTSEGEMWAQKHHTIAPLMSYKMLHHNFEIVVDMDSKLWNVIERDISNDRRIDLMPYIYRLTMDIIGTVALGFDLETIEHPEKEFTDKTGKIVMKRTDMVNDELGALNTRAFIPFEWMWSLPLKPFRKEKRAAAVMTHLFETLIEKHKNEMNSGEEAVDLITLLLQSEQKNDPKSFSYTHKDMLAECFSLFGAGQDTTARSTAFLVLELARRPDIQAKIRQEIQQIAGDAQDWTKYRPVYEDLNKMKYIDNVMKEAQRLWPIAPHLVRMAVNDDTYENIHLPKGDNVFIDVYSYQRDAEYFPDPEKFDPERWDDEKRHSQLLLFGMGARACFGKRLATTEIKLFLFTMMQRFEVVSVDNKEIEAEFNFGLFPKNGVNVLLKRL